MNYFYFCFTFYFEHYINFCMGIIISTYKFHRSIGRGIIKYLLHKGAVGSDWVEISGLDSSEPPQELLVGSIPVQHD